MFLLAFSYLHFVESSFSFGCFCVSVARQWAKQQKQQQQRSQMYAPHIKSNVDLKCTRKTTKCLTKTLLCVCVYLWFLLLCCGLLSFFGAFMWDQTLGCTSGLCWFTFSPRKSMEFIHFFRCSAHCRRAVSMRPGHYLQLLFTTCLFCFVCMDVVLNVIIRERQMNINEVHARCPFCRQFHCFRFEANWIFIMHCFVIAKCFSLCRIFSRLLRVNCNGFRFPCWTCTHFA